MFTSKKTVKLVSAMSLSETLIYEYVTVAKLSLMLSINLVFSEKSSVPLRASDFLLQESALHTSFFTKTKAELGDKFISLYVYIMY